MMRKILLTLVGLIFTISLVACERGLINDKEHYETVELTHNVSKFVKKDGDTEVYEKTLVTEEFYINPKKVLTFSYGVADTLNFLGLEDLGIEKFGLPKGSSLPKLLSVFNDKKYEDVGTLFIPNYDVIELINPDLIILDGRSANEYEKIKSKYPYINVLDASLTTYTIDAQVKLFDNLSKIFTNAKVKLSNKIIEFKNSFLEINEESNNFNAMFLQLNGKAVSVGIGKTGRYGLIFNEFGFLESDENESIYNENNHGAKEVAIEYIAEVNPEVIFIMDRNLISENQASDRSFLKDPLLANVEAIKAKHVYDLDVESWYTVTGGVNATTQMISDIYKFVQTITG